MHCVMVIAEASTQHLPAAWRNGHVSVRLCSVATVFKAVCVATNLKVILKAYYKQKMHPKHFHKLHREIQAMKALNGPYVAEFYATFEDPQCVYIVMEYCEGGDLFKTMLMHGGLLDEQWVCIEVNIQLLTHELQATQHHHHHAERCLADTGSTRPKDGNGVLSTPIAVPMNNSELMSWLRCCCRNSSWPKNSHKHLTKPNV